MTRTTLDLLANRNWESVDGNAYEIAVLEPTLTGIVLPAVSITLGTLLATTVGTLRERQVEIRSCLNREASEKAASWAGSLDGATEYNSAEALIISAPNPQLPPKGGAL